MRRLRKIFSILIVLTVAILVSGVVVLKSIDFSQYKNVIAEEVEKITGRKLSINGEFNLDIGLDTVLAVENVRFANTSWGSQRDMVKMKKLNIDVKILPLVFGDIEVERLILVGLEILLETDNKGVGNWEFSRMQKSVDSKASSSSTIPVIQEIDIKDLKFSYRDGQTGKLTEAFIDELTLSGEDNKSPLDFALSARLDRMEYHAAGSLGSIDTLLNGGKPFAINVQGNIAGVLLSVNGQIDQPREAKGLDLKVSISSKKLEDAIQKAKMYVPALNKMSIPPIGPFRVAGEVKGSADKLNLSNFSAEVGNSNKPLLKLNGSISDLNRVSGIDVQVSASGDELAETVNLVEPLVPQLKRIEVSQVGPYAVSARIKGSLKAVSASKIAAKIGKPSAILLSASGSLADVLSGKGVDLKIGLEGQSLSSVETMTGATLPKVPPFSITAQISDKAGYAVNNLKAKIGLSDLSGDLSVKLSGAKPVIKADLQSDRLDLDELFPDVSQPKLPPQRSTKTKKPQQLFSRKTIERSAFKAIDANISLKIDALKIEGNILEKLEGRASLVSGNLNIDHLFATFDEGRLVSKLTFDASKKRPSLQVKADIRDLPLGKFLKKSKITDTLKLSINTGMDVKGQGASLHEIMASLEGRLKVVGRNGRIDSKFLSGAMSGVSDIIPWFKNEDANKINCFVGRFDINKGKAQSKVILLETVGMTVKGHGNINLGRETLDLTFVPKAKQTSLASFALPMQFKGPLSNPKISPNVSKEAVETVKNIVSTVGSVLLGPVGLLGAIGLNLNEKNKAKRNDPCVSAMGAYSKPKATQSSTPQQSPASSPKPKKGVADSVKKNVGNVIEGAGEAVKGVGNTLKGLFGGSK